MHFLSASESKQWQQIGDLVLAKGGNTTDFQDAVRSNLFSAFCFYIGSRLTTEVGNVPKGKEWFKEGALLEEDGLFSNAFITSFLTRQNDRLIMPSVCFEDPQPYVHFTTTPIMQSSRQNFINYFSHTLPEYSEPVKIIDIGTGNGALCLNILQKLLEEGKVKDFAEVLLIDSSKAMLELARKTIEAEFPNLNIKTINCKIQEVSDKIEGNYHVAFSSLAYHHMPFEDKLFHLNNLKSHIENFIIFELEADNDTPEMNSPELALSVYQSYGRIIDFIFSHDAPIHVAEQSVDNFLMVEEVSFLTQPRGIRTDYHMLRRQWHDLFEQAFDKEFACRSDITCYADEYLDLYALHYGRN
jgi:SAM-dependent methyltransferase